MLPRHQAHRDRDRLPQVFVHVPVEHQRRAELGAKVRVGLPLATRGREVAGHGEVDGSFGHGSARSRLKRAVALVKNSATSGPPEAFTTMLGLRSIAIACSSVNPASAYARYQA